MSEINIKKIVFGSIEEVRERLTEELSKVGFGVLTRIDLDKKIEEKTGKKIKPVIILGACNPELAFEAYTENSDIASLLPCNAVLRQIEPNTISVELAKPTSMMELGDSKLISLAKSADQKLLHVLEAL